MNAAVVDCKHIEIIGSIVYCVHCRRILGYLDEIGDVHLRNVRLVEFSLIGMNTVGNLQALFMKMRENVGKRKYPVDKFDLLDEPQFKKPKLTPVIIMRVQQLVDDDYISRERDNFDYFPLSDSSFESSSDTTVEDWEYFPQRSPYVNNTPGTVYESVYGVTPEGSPINDAINDAYPYLSLRIIHADDRSDASSDIDWSDDEPIHDFNLYGSPARASTPCAYSDMIPISSSYSRESQNFETITISSSPTSFTFENHPNFRVINNVPVLGEYIYVRMKEFLL